uniref:Uncharacterized protein n=1 Tax=Pleonosporium borreri TaxID=2575635 RepID=A0A4D6WYR9_9FLOR|nr:hypothetical protein [Pleonosporium borreri]
MILLPLGVFIFDLKPHLRIFLMLVPLFIYIILNSCIFNIFYYILYIFYFFLYIMHSNLVIFRIYILVLLLFLIFISIFISQEVLNILNTYLFIYRVNKLSSIKHYGINKLNWLLDTYIKYKQWLLCIGFLEFCNLKQILDPYSRYKILGYCYLQTHYFEISKYYYLKALPYEPLDTILLSNLVILYDYLSDAKSVCKYCNKILFIDSDNFFASKYLLKYSNK